MYKLIKVHDPFNRKDREVLLLEPNNETLLEIRNKYLPKDVEFFVSVNGKIIPNSELHLHRIRLYDYLLFVPVLQGGGNDLNNILKMVVGVIAMAVAIWVGGAAGAALDSSFLGALIGGVAGVAVNYVGSWIVNALVPISPMGGNFAGPLPSAIPQGSLSPFESLGYDNIGSGSEGVSTSQTYNWSPTTTQQQGGMIPRFYGTIKVYGNIIAGSSETFPGSSSTPADYEAAQLVTHDDYASYITEVAEAESAKATADAAIIESNRLKAVYEELAAALMMMPFESYGWDQAVVNCNAAYEAWVNSIATANAAIETFNELAPIASAALANAASSGALAPSYEGGFSDMGIVGSPDSNYLSLLIHLGLGPVHSIDSIMINDQPIANFDNVSIEKLYGHLNQAPAKDFNDTKVEYSTSLLVYNGNPITYTTSGSSFDSLEVDVTFPRGLWYMLDNGGLATHSVSYTIEKRPIGGSWATVFSGSTSESKNSSMTRTIKFGVDSGSGKHEIRVTKTSSDYTTSRYGDNMYLTAVREVINDDLEYPRQAMVAIKALANNQLSGSLNFSCVLSGALIRVYQPVLNRKHITDTYSGPDIADTVDSIEWTVMFSNNPAWVAYDILTQPVFDNELNVVRYDGFNPSFLDTTKFKEWADFCDSLVPDGKGGWEKRITFNGGFDTLSTLWDAVLAVCNIGRAMLVVTGNKFTVAIDEASDPVQMFSVANIYMDTFKEVFLPQEDRASEIEASYQNSENDYTQETLTIVNPDIDNPSNKTSIRLIGITKPSEAYRAAKLKLYYNQYLLRICSFDVDVDAIACTVGDVILVQHDIPQWGYSGRVVSATASEIVLDQTVTVEAGKTYSLMVRLNDDTLLERYVSSTVGEYTTLEVTAPFDPVPSADDVFIFVESDTGAKSFRVVDIARSQDFKCTITAIEYNATIYNVDTEQPVLPTPDYSSLDVTPNVTNLTLDELVVKGGDGSLIDVIDVYYDFPNSTVYDHFEIWYKESTDVNYKYAGSSRYDKFRILNVNQNVTYMVAVVTVNNAGLKKSIALSPSASIYTLGKLDPPSTVTNFTATQDGQFVNFKWTHIEDADLWGYEIRKGLTWETASVIVTGVSKDKYTYKAEMDGTYRFLIKAIDTSNIYTTTETAVNITLTDIDAAINIVDTRDEVTKLGGPDGIFTQLSFSGELPAIVNNVGYVDWAYYETLPIDYTKIGPTTIRLSSTFDASDPHATDLSYPTRTDQSYPRDTDLHITMPVDTKMLTSFSEDNVSYSPSGEYFSPESHSLRYLKSWFGVKVPTTTGSFQLEHFIISADVPDIVFNIKGFTVSGEIGSDVVYTDHGYDFYTEPTIQATVIGGGQNKVPIISDKTEDSFHIDLYDVSNNKVSGEVDLRIQGY